MACFICIATCGKCKPATMRMGKCPHCEAPYCVEVRPLFEGAKATCEACGADITQVAKPSPVWCKLTEKMCANPCGSANFAPDKGPQPCLNHTEVG